MTIQHSLIAYDVQLTGSGRVGCNCSLVDERRATRDAAIYVPISAFHLELAVPGVTYAIPADLKGY
jgi:hypothetical protein